MGALHVLTAVLLGQTVAVLAGLTHNFLPPESPSASEAPQQVHTTVFRPGLGNVTCYRIPAVVKTAKGTLVAFAEARYGSCDDNSAHRIASRRSTDEGASWSDVSFVQGSASHWVSNPWVIARRSGPLVLLYTIRVIKHGNPVGESNGVIISEDDGVTWGPESDIGLDFGAAKGAFMGPGAGVELEGSGRLLAVSHAGAYKEDYISYSDDGGMTWVTEPRFFPSMDEGTMADLGNGEVLLNMRHLAENVTGRAVARSMDGGLTWSDVTYDAELLGTICEASLARIGDSIYFSNPADVRSRKHLTIKRSDDGGHTWVVHQVVHQALSAGYSSLLQSPLRDGLRSGILYEAAPGSIDFASFPLQNAEPTGYAIGADRSGVTV